MTLIGLGPSLLLFFAATSCVGAEWIRTTSYSTEVYTDAGPETALRVRQRFEQARRVFSAFEGPLAFGASAMPAAPLRVLVFANEAEFGPYRPSRAASAFYQSGPEQDAILMFRSPDSERIAFHEYVHFVLNHSSLKLPQWLEEGLAEFYSNVELDRDNARVGAPIESHLQMLARNPWLDAGALAAVGKNSAEYNEEAKAGVFYAESWALVRMLTLDSAWRGGTRAFLLLSGQGAPGPAAFREAFGKSLEDAVADLRRKLNQRLTPLQISLAAQEKTNRVVEPVPAAEALLVQADLLALTGNHELAEKLYLRAAGAGAKGRESARLEAGLAALDLKLHQDGRARERYEKAIELDPANGRILFEYAMLRRDQGAPRPEVDRLLERAVQAAPMLAEAQFLLGIRAADEGRFADAIRYHQAAIAAMPRQSYFWHALGYAQFKTGELEAARTSAANALATAETEHEVSMARALLEMTRAAPGPVFERKPPVTTPPSWNEPKGDRRAVGTFESVECLDEGVRLKIRTQEGELVLRVADPRHVALRHAPAESLEFSCGPQSKERIAVEYFAATSVVTLVDFAPEKRE